MVRLHLIKEVICEPGLEGGGAADHRTPRRSRIADLTRRDLGNPGGMSRGVAGLACCFKRVSLAVIVESGGGGPDQGGTREKWPDSRCTVRWGHWDFQVGNGGDRNPGCYQGWSLST